MILAASCNIWAPQFPMCRTGIILLASQCSCEDQVYLWKPSFLNYEVPLKIKVLELGSVFFFLSILKSLTREPLKVEWENPTNRQVRGLRNSNKGCHNLPFTMKYKYEHISSPSLITSRFVPNKMAKPKILKQADDSEYRYIITNFHHLICKIQITF